MSSANNMEIFRLKSALRTQVRSALKKLSSSQRCSQSLKISKKVVAHPKYLSSEGVAVFLSMNDEVDTIYIIQDIFESGKRCFIPRYAEGGSHMTMVHMQTLSEIENLPYTKWNIQQPSEVDEKHDCLHTGGLDLILTPGLAFTKEGFRLGRGKGYYDSFIRNYSSSYNRPYLIGLSLSPSLVSNIPITDTDVKMDEVIYEMEINE